MTRQSKVAFALIFTLLIGATLGFFVLRSWANPGFTPVPFSGAAWKQADPEVRGHMVDDLRSRHEIPGMAKNEVRKFLGPPNEDQEELQRFRYYLGRRGRHSDAWFFTDYSLLIKFDGDGVATDAYVAD